MDTALDASDALLRERAENGETAGSAALWQEVRLKEGDALQGVTGTGALLLAGSAQVIYASGAVVDVTTGSVVPDGAPLSVGHRYLVAEDTSAAFTVTSKTAVLDYQGQSAFTYSDRPDYNAMAAALKSLHLFKGTFTGCGSGYDLEAAPTRLQAVPLTLPLWEDGPKTPESCRRFSDPRWLHGSKCQDHDQRNP